MDRAVGDRAVGDRAVGDKAVELADEQSYFDRARKHRERHLATLDDAASAAANAGAAHRLRSWVAGRKGANRPGDEAVAVGRIDDGKQPRYIGRELIRDERGEVLVVNWQTPAAAPYYQATYEDPRGLNRKRTFTCSGNTIKDFEDLVFAQLARDVARLSGVDGALLSELESARTGAMRDIVATIQAAQYELINAPLEQLLVIEGGPGTGKTAVALHRVSSLLFNHRERLAARDVLVVGPHPAFTRYIRTVLPALRDGDVAQCDIDQLAPQVQRGRVEPSEVQRLKGDARMAGLLARALAARIGQPEPAERLQFDGRYVTLTGAEVAAVLAGCRDSPGPYGQGRQLLRDRLTELARERGAPVDRPRLEPVENLVERLWPRISPAALVSGLLSARRRLAAAAGVASASGSASGAAAASGSASASGAAEGSASGAGPGEGGGFTAGELALLYRRGADRLSQEIWSAADLPLLDEAEALIAGVPQRYGHIVLDEAQDLSPMQLRSVARRSAGGSLTVVGDLSQSTGAWARDNWDEVTALLPDLLPRRVESLRYGYRVPRQVYEWAAQLLPVAAPGTVPAVVVRDGPAEPGIHRVGAQERAGRAALLAAGHARQGRFVGLICPPVHRAELEQALAANEVTWSSADRGELDSAINLVSPQEAKGLEFDAVVVVEPEDIVAGDPRGHRLLFVAFTRTIRYLDVVCVGEPMPLGSLREPMPLGEPTRHIPAPREPAPDAAALDRLAEQIAALVVGGAPATMWDEALQRAAAVLDASGERERATGRHRRG